MYACITEVSIERASTMERKTLVPRYIFLELAFLILAATLKEDHCRQDRNMDGSKGVCTLLKGTKSYFEVKMSSKKPTKFYMVSAPKAHTSALFFYIPSRKGNKETRNGETALSISVCDQSYPSYPLRDVLKTCQLLW